MSSIIIASVTLNQDTVMVAYAFACRIRLHISLNILMLICCYGSIISSYRPTERSFFSNGIIPRYVYKDTKHLKTICL